MSAAIAMAPSPAPHDRPSYAEFAPSVTPSSPPTHRVSASATPNVGAQPIESRSPDHRLTACPKTSSAGSRNGVPPKIIVKKEPPPSPELPTPRHRPRKLDLSKNTNAVGAAKQSGGGQLTSDRGPASSIQDVGLACLSPGFVTQDPTMREQLVRSISVRDQQRQLIESRLDKSAKSGNAPVESAKDRDGFKKRVPPGLSIVAPSHEQFANERVIQSAPLHQSFPGRHQHLPPTRQVANQFSNLSNSSHIHHVPATQTSNRLPPISDVFAAGNLGAHGEPTNHNTTSMLISTTTPSRHNYHSPRLNPPQLTASAGRYKEYRSAEDAQAELSGGRPELLPKLVHYGGHQPPTPPSPGRRGPLTGDALRQTELTRNGSSMRRERAEYEEGQSPPLGSGPAPKRRNEPFGEGRDSPRMQQAKKEEFVALCARAWDLFHS